MALHEVKRAGGAVGEFVFVHGLMFTNDAFPSPWGVTLLVGAALISTGQAGNPLACLRRRKGLLRCFGVGLFTHEERKAGLQRDLRRGPPCCRNVSSCKQAQPRAVPRTNHR